MATICPFGSVCNEIALNSQYLSFPFPGKKYDIWEYDKLTDTSYLFGWLSHCYDFLLSNTINIFVLMSSYLLANYDDTLKRVTCSLTHVRIWNQSWVILIPSHFRTYKWPVIIIFSPAYLTMVQLILMNS